MSSISFTVRPPSSSAPHRPGPTPMNGHGNGSASGSRQNSRMGPPSRRMFEDADSGSEGEDGFSSSRRAGSGSRDERVDGFSNGKIRSDRPKQKEEALIIPALPNRDWRESSRRVPTYKPESRQQTGEVVTHERTGDGPQRSGLRRIEREVKAEEGDAEDVKPDLHAMDARNGLSNGNGYNHANGSNGNTTDTVKTEPLTLEQQALREILAGQPSSPSAADRARQEMVIAMESNRVLSESEALKRDIGALPEESTLEDFEAVPISAFGIAALRGMGWDPKSTENVKAREVTRRPQLLGLGATPMKADIMPTHKKGDNGKDKRSYQERSGRGYNAAGLLIKKEREQEGSGADSGRSTPVLRRESRMGSVEGDPDANKRRRVDGGDEGREAKRRDVEGSDYSRSRRRDEDEDVRGSRNKDSRDKDRGRDGRRYETEEERARRKAKERERDSDRDRYRERDRERDRDRDRRRDDRDRDRYKDRDGDRRR